MGVGRGRFLFTFPVMFSATHHFLELDEEPVTGKWELFTIQGLLRLVSIYVLGPPKPVGGSGG